jgi:small-conductance mechanosensitive channel
MNDYRDLKQLVESTFNEVVNTIGAWLPSLAGAIVLMIAGLVIAWLLKWTILRVGKGVDTLATRVGVGMAARMRWPLSNILAGVAYWLVLLFFAAAAAEGLRLPGLAEWLGKLISYLPSVFAALLIILAGFVLGGAVRDKIVSGASSSNAPQAHVLGGAVRAIVIVLTIVIGLGQMGLDIRLVEYLLTILAAATLAGFALAFGLGASPSVSNIIASRNVRRHYSVGQRVRVGEIEGTILELSTAFVVLDTDHGRTLIPAKVFEERISELLDTEVSDEY